VLVDGERGAALRWAAPEAGEHSRQTLEEAGFDPREIAELETLGVVAPRAAPEPNKEAL
jgi:crotonobetainyl-CoA:carnitine CoA-transferase CaiB-like acyl-CoA transferase